MKRQGFGVTLTVHGAPTLIEPKRFARSSDEIPEIDVEGDELQDTRPELPRLRLVSSQDLGLDPVSVPNEARGVDESDDELPVQLHPELVGTIPKPLRPRP